MFLRSQPITGISAQNCSVFPFGSNLGQRYFKKKIRPKYAANPLISGGFRPFMQALSVLWDSNLRNSSPKVRSELSFGAVWRCPTLFSAVSCAPASSPALSCGAVSIGKFPRLGLILGLESAYLKSRCGFQRDFESSGRGFLHIFQRFAGRLCHGYPCKYPIRVWIIALSSREVKFLPLTIKCALPHSARRRNLPHQMEGKYIIKTQDNKLKPFRRRKASVQLEMLPPVGSQHLPHALMNL